MRKGTVSTLACPVCTKVFVYTGADKARSKRARRVKLVHGMRRSQLGGTQDLEGLGSSRTLTYAPNNAGHNWSHDEGDAVAGSAERRSRSCYLARSDILSSNSLVL